MAQTSTVNPYFDQIVNDAYSGASNNGREWGLNETVGALPNQDTLSNLQAFQNQGRLTTHYGGTAQQAANAQRNTNNISTAYSNWFDPSGAGYKSLAGTTYDDGNGTTFQWSDYLNGMRDTTAVTPQGFMDKLAVTKYETDANGNGRWTHNNVMNLSQEELDSGKWGMTSNFNKRYGNIEMANNNMSNLTKSRYRLLAERNPEIKQLMSNMSGTFVERYNQAKYQLGIEALGSFNRFVNSVDTSEGQAYNPDNVHDWFDTDGKYYQKYGNIVVTLEDGTKKKFSDILSEAREDFYLTDDDVFTFKDGTTMSVADFKQTVLDRRQAGIDYMSAVKESHNQIDDFLADYPELQKAVNTVDITNGDKMDYYETAVDIIGRFVNAFDVMNIVANLSNLDDNEYDYDSLTRAFNMATQFGNVTTSEGISTYWNWYSGVNGSGFKNWLNSKTDEEKLALDGKSADAQYQLYLQSEEYKKDKIRILYAGTFGRVYEALPSFDDYKEMCKTGTLEVTSTTAKNVPVGDLYYSERAFANYERSYLEYCNKIWEDANPGIFGNVLSSSLTMDEQSQLVRAGLFTLGPDGKPDYSNVSLMTINDICNYYGSGVIPVDSDIIETIQTLNSMMQFFDNGVTDLSATANWMTFANDIGYNTYKWINTFKHTISLATQNRSEGTDIYSKMRFGYSPEEMREKAAKTEVAARSNILRTQFAMDTIKELSEVSPFVYNVVENLENMTLDRLVGGSASLAVMAARIWGEQSALTWDEATGTYNIPVTIARTAAETISEMVFGSVFYKGLINIPAVIARSSMKILPKTAAILVVQGMEEGAEEVIASHLNYAFDNVIDHYGGMGNVAKSELIMSQMVEEALTAFVCAFIGAGTAIASGEGSLQQRANSYVNSIGMFRVSEAMKASRTGRTVNGISPSQADAWLVTRLDTLSPKQRAWMYQKAGVSEEYTTVINGAATTVTEAVSGLVKDGMTHDEFVNALYNDTTINELCDSLFGTDTEYSKQVADTIKAFIASDPSLISKTGAVDANVITADNVKSIVNKYFSGMLSGDLYLRTLAHDDIAKITDPINQEQYLAMVKNNPEKFNEALKIFNDTAREAIDSKFSDLNSVEEDWYLRDYAEQYVNEKKAEVDAAKAEYDAAVRALEEYKAEADRILSIRSKQSSEVKNIESKIKEYQESVNQTKEEYDNILNSYNGIKGKYETEKANRINSVLPEWKDRLENDSYRGGDALTEEELKEVSRTIWDVLNGKFNPNNTSDRQTIMWRAGELMDVDGITLWDLCKELIEQNNIKPVEKESAFTTKGQVIYNPPTTKTKTTVDYTAKTETTEKVNEIIKNAHLKYIRSLQQGNIKKNGHYVQFTQEQTDTLTTWLRDFVSGKHGTISQVVTRAVSTKFNNDVNSLALKILNPEITTDNLYKEIAIIERMCKDIAYNLAGVNEETYSEAVDAVVKSKLDEFRKNLAKEVEYPSMFSKGLQETIPNDIKTLETLTEEQVKDIIDSVIEFSFGKPRAFIQTKADTTLFNNIAQKVYGEVVNYVSANAAKIQEQYFHDTHSTVTEVISNAVAEQMVSEVKAETKEEVPAVVVESAKVEPDGITVTYSFEQAKKINNLTKDVENAQKIVNDKTVIYENAERNSHLTNPNPTEIEVINTNRIYNPLPNQKFTTYQVMFAYETYLDAIKHNTSTNDTNNGGIAKGGLNVAKARAEFFKKTAAKGMSVEQALAALNQRYSEFYLMANNKQQARGVAKDAANMRTVFKEEFEAAKAVNEDNIKLFNKLSETARIYNPNATYTGEIKIHKVATDVVSLNNYVSQINESTTTVDGHRTFTGEVSKNIQHYVTGAEYELLDSATFASAADVSVNFWNGSVNLSQTIHAFETQSQRFSNDNQNLFRGMPDGLKSQVEWLRTATRDGKALSNMKIFEMTEEEISKVVPIVQNMARYLTECRHGNVVMPNGTSYTVDLEALAAQSPQNQSWLAEKFDKIKGLFINMDSAISFTYGNSEASMKLREAVNNSISAKLQWKDRIYGLWVRDENIKNAVAEARSDLLNIKGVELNGMQAIAAMKILLTDSSVVVAGNGLYLNGDIELIKHDVRLQDNFKNRSLSEEELKAAQKERENLKQEYINALDNALNSKSYTKIINHAIKYSYASAVDLANIGRFIAFGEQLEIRDDYYPLDTVDNYYASRNQGSKKIHTQDETHNLGHNGHNGRDIVVRDALDQLIDYTDRMAEQVYNTNMGRILAKANSIKGENGNYAKPNKSLSKIQDRLLYGDVESDSNILGKISKAYATAYLGLNVTSAFKQMPSFTMANAYADAHQSDYFNTIYGNAADTLFEMYIKNANISGIESNRDIYRQSTADVMSTYSMRYTDVKSYYDTRSVIGNWVMHSVYRMDLATTGGVTRVVTASAIKHTQQNWNKAHPEAKVTGEELCDMLTNPDAKQNADLVNMFNETLQHDLTSAMFTQPTSDILMSANLGFTRNLLPFMGQRIQYLNKLIQGFNDIQTSTTEGLRNQAKEQTHKAGVALVKQSVLMSLITTAASLIDPKQRKKYFDEDNEFKWKYLIGKLSINFVDPLFSILPFIGSKISGGVDKLINAATGADVYNSDMSNIYTWVRDDIDNMESFADGLLSGKGFKQSFTSDTYDTAMNLITALTMIPANNLIRLADYGMSVGFIASDAATGDDKNLRLNKLKDIIIGFAQGKDVPLVSSKVDGIVSNAKLTSIFEDNADVFVPTSGYVSDWIDSHSKENMDGDKTTINLTAKGNFIWMLNDMKESGLITDNDINAIVASWNSAYPEGQITLTDLMNEAYTTAGKRWLNGDESFNANERISMMAGTKNRDEWVQLYTAAGLINDKGEFSDSQDVVLKAYMAGKVTADNYKLLGLTDEDYNKAVDNAIPYQMYNALAGVADIEEWDNEHDGKISASEIVTMHNSDGGQELYDAFVEAYGELPENFFTNSQQRSMDNKDIQRTLIHYDATATYTNAQLKKTVEGNAWLMDGEDGSFNNAKAIAFKAGTENERTWFLMCEKAGFVDDNGDVSFTAPNVAEAIHNGLVTAENYQKYGISTKTFNAAMEKMTGYNLYDELVSIIPSGSKYDSNDDGQLSASEMVALHNDYPMTANGQLVYDMLINNVDVEDSFFTTKNNQSMAAADTKKKNDEAKASNKDASDSMKGVFDADYNGSVSQADLAGFTEESARALSDEELAYIYRTKLSTASASSIKKSSGMTALMNEYNRRRELWLLPEYTVRKYPEFTPATFDDLF